MSRKILQIIPAPSGMYAEYRTDEEEIEHIPVVSLMLIDDDGLQYLSPATFDTEYGVNEEPENAVNFVRYIIDSQIFAPVSKF